MSSTAKPLVIDDQERGLFRVNRRAFTDRAIIEQEWEQIFNRCWLYVGHDSEIPSPGDFRTRKVAGRPVILIRGSDGVVRVLLNTCTHRGALVCREKAGNTKTFQCAYHAWTYNNQGELIGVPGEEAYSAAFDRQKLGLASAPRVEGYRGFIFVSFNPSVEGLVDYLAGAREYLDLMCDYAEEGLNQTA